MTALLSPLLLAAALVATALGGPMLLRGAAPALMRTPRTAVALLLSAAGLWLMATAALSLLLAWLLTGPAILPAPVAGACQRCLDAATPFPAGDLIDTMIPVALLLLLPAAGLLALVGLGIARGVRRRIRNRAVARGIADRSRRAWVQGHQVLLTRDPHPTALSLPRSLGGIVISESLIDALTPPELAAVLAHEREHVHGRHHLVLAILDALVAPLRGVPFLAAIVDAVPHYLEIAADDAARRRTGTPALASALLKLGEPPASSTAVPGGVAGALHAAGPDRIGHLVAPTKIGAAAAPASLLGAAGITLAVFTAAIHLPYLSVILDGCHLAY
ncbi:M56 family metallopeptidase [Microbacterium sp. MYb62]|uniref:M56 family metallopeptidase n=1 Tax=Microbacterium sp. MYb62 TaxID=1848690 RepID=UPI000CFD2690|nr:M56 family metallopeptidase [Microbacterium sp. MYb62]PRB14132.1 Zn-dependent protease with chaperone function [Microbacterium sp. MYb62]